MSKTLAIIGAGHLGQQIAHFAISDMHYKCVVFFDDSLDLATVNGHEIIGKTDSIIRAFSEKMFDEILIGIGYKHMSSRKSFFEKLKNIIPFGKIIHSTAWIDPTSSIGCGSVIYPMCSVDYRSKIENNVLINIGTTIAHDTIVNSHCFISPRVAIAGFVSIGEQSILGINSTVIDNVKITAKTQIGGGAVVIKNVAKRGLYVGNPTKLIR